MLCFGSSLKALYKYFFAATKSPSWHLHQARLYWTIALRGWFVIANAKIWRAASIDSAWRVASAQDIHHRTSSGSYWANFLPTACINSHF